MLKRRTTTTANLPEVYHFPRIAGKMGYRYSHFRGGDRLSSVHQGLFTTFLRKGAFNMLWTIFVILLVLWLLGLVSSYTLGGFIHILLVLAVVVLLINLLSGRRPAL